MVKRPYSSSSLGAAALATLVLGAALLLVPVRAAERRIVAIADVHGAASSLASILQDAGLVDAQKRWSGGNAVLVQTGDLADRGDGVREVLELMMALEPQARAAGGRVEQLLGNHEFMNLVGNTRDATPEIFQAWADGQSEARRERVLEEAQARAGNTLDRAAWLAAHPPGYVEYRESLAPNGRYGKWLRTKRIAVKIGDTVFMHAGIAPGTTASIDAINAQAKTELQAWDNGVRWLEENRLIPPLATMQEVVPAAVAEFNRIAARKDTRESTRDDQRVLLLLHPVATILESSLFTREGPMWFRGYSTWPDQEGAPLMAAILKRYDAKRFIGGHTTQPDGRIRSRFDGGVFLIDTGMLGGRYYPGGRPSALEIVGDRVTPIYAAQQRPLAPAAVRHH